MRRLLPWVLGAWLVAVHAADSTNHWAFQPLRETPIPSSPAAWGPVGTPVDHFIRASLQREGLTPAPPAERATLLRRLSFALTGLPPAPAEVEAFEHDPSPEAYSRQVERWLASPHYGERWGRWWLDLARYADTNGQDENKVMANAWRYRDWVIRAFNADQPFDQFVIHQLAGDLLPAAGVPETTVFDRWIATGFLVLGPKMLAEQDKPKLVMDMVDEQIDTVSRALLGLTVSCSRCHDHKYDPVPMRDYYALAGIFKSTRTMENLDFVSKFNERRIATAEELAARREHAEALKRQNEAIETAVREATTELLARWRKEWPRWVAAAPGTNAVQGLDALGLERTRTFFNGPAATNGLADQVRQLAALTNGLAARLAQLEQLPPGLRIGPGRVGQGFVGEGRNYLEVAHRADLEPAQFTLETWVRVEKFATGGDPRRWLVAKNANEWADGHYALFLDGATPAAYLNVSGGRGGEIALRSTGAPLQAGRWHHLAMTFDEAVLRLFVDGELAAEQAVGRARVRGQGPLAVGRRPDGFVNFVGALDEVRLLGRALDAASIRQRFAEPAAVPADALIARWDFETLSAAERAAVEEGRLREALFGPEGLLTAPKDPLPAFPPAVRAHLTDLEQKRAALQAAAPPPEAMALAVAEAPPVELPLHLRGSHLNLGHDPIPRGFIRVLSRRAPEPVPADHSGRLELARWLVSAENPLTARVTVNRLWQAYFGEGLVRTPDNFGIRGTPPTHPELLDWLALEFIRSGWSLKHLHRLIVHSATWQQSSAYRPAPNDPDNRWLSRAPRLRLEAEMVRDALLTVSGRLDRQAGGSLVNWKNNEYTPADEVSAVSRRRSIYLPIVRDRVFDVFTIFDGANPSIGISRRIPTVVSHQALFFLNSPLVKDSARAVAASIGTSGVERSAGIARAYRTILQRDPSAAELERAQRFLATAAPLAGPNRSFGDWTALCQALLAANEFLYLD